MVDPSYVVTVFLVVCSTRGLLAVEETEDTAGETSRFVFRSGANLGEARNRRLSDEINPLNMPLEYDEAYHNGDTLAVERENMDEEAPLKPTDKTPKDFAAERKALTYRRAQLGGQRPYWAQQGALQDSYGQMEQGSKIIKSQNYPGSFGSFGQPVQKYVHPGNTKGYVHKGPKVPVAVGQNYNPWNSQYIPAKNSFGAHGWNRPLNIRSPGYEKGDQEWNNEEGEVNGDDFYEDESAKLSNRAQAKEKETFDDYESENESAQSRRERNQETEEFEERTVMFTGTIKIPKQKTTNSHEGNFQQSNRVQETQMKVEGGPPQTTFPLKGTSQLGQGPGPQGLGQQGLGQQGLGPQGFGKYGLGQQGNLRQPIPSDKPVGTGNPAQSSQPGKSGYGQRFPNQQDPVQSATGKPGNPQSLTNKANSGGKINQPSKTTSNAVRSYPQYRSLKSIELGIPTRKALAMNGNMIFV